MGIETIRQEIAKKFVAKKKHGITVTKVDYLGIPGNSCAGFPDEDLDKNRLNGLEGKANGWLSIRELSAIMSSLGLKSKRLYSGTQGAYPEDEVGANYIEGGNGELYFFGDDGTYFDSLFSLPDSDGNIVAIADIAGNSLNLLGQTFEAVHNKRDARKAAINHDGNCGFHTMMHILLAKKIYEESIIKYGNMGRNFAISIINNITIKTIEQLCKKIKLGDGTGHRALGTILQEARSLIYDDDFGGVDSGIRDRVKGQIRNAVDNFQAQINIPISFTGKGGALKLAEKKMPDKLIKMINGFTIVRKDNKTREDLILKLKLTKKKDGSFEFDLLRQNGSSYKAKNKESKLQVLRNLFDKINQQDHEDPLINIFCNEAITQIRFQQALGLGGRGGLEISGTYGALVNATKTLDNVRVLHGIHGYTLSGNDDFNKKSLKAEIGYLRNQKTLPRYCIFPFSYDEKHQYGVVIDNLKQKIYYSDSFGEYVKRDKALKFLKDFLSEKGKNYKIEKVKSPVQESSSSCGFHAAANCIKILSKNGDKNLKAAINDNENLSFLKEWEEPETLVENPDSYLRIIRNVELGEDICLKKRTIEQGHRLQKIVLLRRIETIRKEKEGDYINGDALGLKDIADSLREVYGIKKRTADENPNNLENAKGNFNTLRYVPLDDFFRRREIKNIDDITKAIIPDLPEELELEDVFDAAYQYFTAQYLVPFKNQKHLRDYKVDENQGDLFNDYVKALHEQQEERWLIDIVANKTNSHDYFNESTKDYITHVQEEGFKLSKKSLGKLLTIFEDTKNKFKTESKGHAVDSSDTSSSEHSSDDSKESSSEYFDSSSDEDLDKTSTTLAKANAILAEDSYSRLTPAMKKIEAMGQKINEGLFLNRNNNSTRRKIFEVPKYYKGIGVAFENIHYDEIERECTITLGHISENGTAIQAGIKSGFQLKIAKNTLCDYFSQDPRDSFSAKLLEDYAIQFIRDNGINPKDVTILDQHNRECTIDRPVGTAMYQVNNTKDQINLLNAKGFNTIVKNPSASLAAEKTKHMPPAKSKGAEIGL